MARPHKNTVDYFPHYISDGKKMAYIVSKFGGDGYMTWLRLLEVLAKSDFHYYDIRDEINLDWIINTGIKVSEETFKQVTALMAKWGELDAELFAHGIIYSNRFIESVEDAYKKRSNKPLTRNELIAKIGLNELLPTETMVSDTLKDDQRGLGARKPQLIHPKTTQRKGKESIEKERREEKTQIAEDFVSLSLIFYDKILEKYAYSKKSNDDFHLASLIQKIKAVASVETKIYQQRDATGKECFGILLQLIRFCKFRKENNFFELSKMDEYLQRNWNNYKKHWRKKCAEAELKPTST